MVKIFNTTPNFMNTYYFYIPKASVLEFIQAPSLLEAKEAATEEWLPFLSQMEWLPTDD
jgi:hypothetical protein